jgi:hypothetical protein
MALVLVLEAPPQRIKERKPQISPLRFAPVEMTIQWLIMLWCLQ